MEESIIGRLKSVVGEARIILETGLQERYNHIWTMDEGLQAKAVVLPESTFEVSEILKICFELNQSVVVHGGLTNLVGSTETAKEDVVISMERMTKIEELDEISRTVTVESGVILQTVQELAADKNLLFPMNFGAKGSAQIGGMISTNAGGLKVFKYGMTRNLVLGLEAVLADGTIISSMKKIIKDNSGYDLKQLFIGSEGTLGIVTKAILRLVESPTSRNSAFVGMNSYHKVVSFLKYMDNGLAGNLSSFELIWGPTYEAMTTEPSINRPPIRHGYKYYVLLEASGFEQKTDEIIFENLLANGLDNDYFEDAVLAMNESDLNWFWKIREDVLAVVSLCKYDQHFDVSLPIPLIGEYVANVKTQLIALNEIDHVFAFGHVADGNIHFIIGKDNNGSFLREEINEIVYGPLKGIGGSVSAEHGIGTHKKKYLHLCRSREEIELMKQLKITLDPKQILNRGKVF